MTMFNRRGHHMAVGIVAESSHDLLAEELLEVIGILLSPRVHQVANQCVVCAGYVGSVNDHIVRLVSNFHTSSTECSNGTNIVFCASAQDHSAMLLSLNKIEGSRPPNLSVIVKI